MRRGRDAADNAAAPAGPAQGSTTPVALLLKWLLPCVLMLLGLRSTWKWLTPDVAVAHAALSHAAAGPPGRSRGDAPGYYFYNEATGQVQWEDPGDVPHEELDGTRYWIDEQGAKTHQDPSMGKYAWIEQYSQELKKPYFFNLETSESTWERPADLSWRRITVDDDS